MKIGIDARLYTNTGIGRYIRNLITELEKVDNEDDYIIFVTDEGSEKYHPKNPHFKKWLTNFKEYTFSEQTRLPMEFYKAKLDLLHVPHFNIPLLYNGKTVVTIHDLIMHKNELNEDRSKGSFNYKQMAYKQVVKKAIKHPKKIIVPSIKVKNEIVEMIPNADESKIVVTYEGVDNHLLQYKINDEKVVRTRLEEMFIRKQYFLYVGSAYPHKNLDNLIVAFKELMETYKYNGQMVFAGKVDRFSQRTAGYVHALHLDDNIIFAAKYTEDNIVTDNDLAYLYSGAMAYVFPSLDEGFSITPLEAQAFGVPVVLSDITTHREVFGDSVLYFDPKSNIDITDKMYQIYEDAGLRDRLIQKGFENVKKYSWNNLARETLKIYESCVSNHNDK